MTGRAATSVCSPRRYALGRPDHVEGVSQPKQYAHCNGPLVSLEMVEVGAGDAELARHLALVEPALAPQSLEPRTEEELALKHHSEAVKVFTKTQEQL